MNEHQLLAIQALERMKMDVGEDLYRARIAFKNYTFEEMHKKYGESNDTPAEIILRYQIRENKIYDAIIWVKSQKGDK